MKSLEGKLGIPEDKLIPLLFMLISACVHYALFEDQFYLKAQIEVLKEDITKRYQISREIFSKAPEEDQEFLKNFSFICLLSFDAYVKKQIIEKMIDQMKGE